MTTQKRLITKAKVGFVDGIEGLNDLAVNIENEAIAAGGKPGTDYTFKDIFGWAVSVYSAKRIGKEIDDLKNMQSDDETALWGLLDKKL